MVKNQKLVFASVPKGVPNPGEHTKLQSSDIDLENAPLNGGVLLKNMFLSLDPYMRGRMRPAEVKSYVPAFTLNEPLSNFGVAEVVRSEQEGYSKGEHVYYMAKFETYSIVKDMKAVGAKKLDALKKENPNVTWSSFIGGLGMPGKTANCGLRKIGRPKKGETMYISSAAGAVGSLVGQLAKAQGLYVIGSAGSDEKVAFLKELGFDHAFNYKKNDVGEELTKLGKPIDINFENVGAAMLDTLLMHMNNHGRIILCGLAATYNGEQYAYKNIAQLLVKRVHMEGFIVGDNPEFDEQFYNDVPKLVSNGQFKLKEDIADGWENAEQAFVNLLTGKNTGKAVIKVSD